MFLTQSPLDSHELAFKPVLIGVQKRQPAAAKKLIDQLLPLIYLYVFFQVPTVRQAQTITLDIFSTVYHQLRLRTNPSFLAWVIAITQKKITQFWRQQPVRTSSSKFKSGSVKKLDSLNLETLKVHLISLPSHYRQIIILRYLSSVSINQAARLINSSVSNVRVMAYRAINKLKTNLKLPKSVTNRQLISQLEKLSQECQPDKAFVQSATKKMLQLVKSSAPQRPQFSLSVPTLLILTAAFLMAVILFLVFIH